MGKKHHSSVNVPMIKTTDPEGHLVIDSRSIETTFDDEGTLTFNKNNGVLAWNCGDVTHLNFTSNDFMIIFDAESNILTLTSGEKNIYYDLDKLKEIINEQGLTIQDMDKILAEEEKNTIKGDEENGNKEENNN